MFFNDKIFLLAKLHQHITALVSLYQSQRSYCRFGSPSSHLNAKVGRGATKYLSYNLIAYADDLSRIVVGAKTRDLLKGKAQHEFK